MPAVQKMIVMTLLAALTLLPAFNAWAVTSNDVNQQMRDAQKLYFRGKAQEADEALKKAENMAVEILAGSDTAEKEKVKRLDGRLKKLRKDIDRKLGRSVAKAASTGAAAPASGAKPAATAADSKALPSHVVSDLKVVEQYIDSTRKNLDSGDIRNARRSLDGALGRLRQTAERKKRYITPEHPEYQTLLAGIEKMDVDVSAAEKRQADQKAAADKAAAETKAESDKWVAKLKPYVIGLGQTGYDPERYFAAGYTEDRQEMAKRAMMFGKVSADMAAYRETGPGDNATEELQLIIRKLEYALKTFQESTTSMAELKLQKAGQQIDYIHTWLNKEAKKIGTKDIPLTMNRMTFESARRELDGAASLLGGDEARVKALDARYKEALVLDAKLAKSRVAQTRMIPDKFSGSELNDLKKKAEEVLGAAKPGISMLRTTIVSPDWQEESVVEWTDTTRSALRHRVTHSVSAQVAGKAGGETTLYTLHLAKDRRTDGSWGQLHGHVMFEDPILEENVNK